MVDSHFHAMAVARRIDEARKVQALRAEIKQEREANRRKAIPAKTCFDDPAFNDRILARAERHAKILAQMHAGTYKPKPKVSARQRWDNAIDAALPKCGGNRVKAVALVNKTNPGLRQAFIAEANSKR